MQTASAIGLALAGTPRQYGWALVESGVPMSEADRIVKRMQRDKADNNGH